MAVLLDGVTFSKYGNMKLSVKKPLLLKLLNNTDPVPINLRGVVVLMTPSATRAHDGEPMSSRNTSTSAVGVVGARRRELDSLVLISCFLLARSVRGGGQVGDVFAEARTNRYELLGERRLC